MSDSRFDKGIEPLPSPPLGKGRELSFFLGESLAEMRNVLCPEKPVLIWLDDPYCKAGLDSTVHSETGTSSQTAGQSLLT